MTDTPRPDADLQQLAPIIGTWRLGGDTSGTATYEWMDGGFFIIQRLDMRLFEQDMKAIEIIGHLRPFGQEPSADIRSRAYDNLGNTLDYVYEMDGNVLTIWGGEKDSAAYYRATFSADRNSAVGEWTYPGGGYTSTMNRVG